MLQRREDKHARVVEDERLAQEYRRAWPVVVSQKTVYSCLNNYFQASEWSEPPVCAVCGRYQRDCVVVTFTATDAPSFHLETLRVTDRFIIQKCVVQGLSAAFSFDCPIIDGLMLERAGIVDCSSDCVRLFLCSSCRTSLSKPDKVPRFALANNLYRGQLPLHLQDISWVEEKVCAIYCVTAHVTRLFQSSDPAQPKVFHGNTCAHDTNVVSTASVLPRTPSDVNGLLSIIFIGPGKFNAKQLGTVFRRSLWTRL
ncbi:hypothetical protein EV424DRAFT_461362 [Suillus variegatus]|nr:hypothetical protein EV424DRAFT_461362 [Suillus variegatus]